MKLPAAPVAYDPANEAQLRAALTQADSQNRKANEDVEIGRKRLLLTDTATGKPVQIVVTNGAVAVVSE